LKDIVKIKPSTSNGIAKAKTHREKPELWLEDNKENTIIMEID
jgi:hypothetical protein